MAKAGIYLAKAKRAQYLCAFFSYSKSTSTELGKKIFIQIMTENGGKVLNHQELHILYVQKKYISTALSA